MILIDAGIALDFFIFTKSLNPKICQKFANKKQLIGLKAGNIKISKSDVYC
jgi:hypothetical protein